MWPKPGLLLFINFFCVGLYGSQPKIFTNVYLSSFPYCYSEMPQPKQLKGEKGILNYRSRAIQFIRARAT